MSRTGFHLRHHARERSAPCGRGRQSARDCDSGRSGGKLRVLGLHLQEGLRKLQSRYGCVGDVRGRGLMAGMEIVGDPVTKETSPALNQALADKVYELGLWSTLSSMPIAGGAFRIAPPITSTREQIDEGIDILERALAETEGTLPLY